MNKPIYIVIHCSATREDREFTENQVNESHVARGFGKWGYHYYIRKDGRVVKMRAENEIGAHDNCLVPGEKVSYNRCSIGICYEGGLDERGLPADTRTYAQRCTLMDLLRQLRRDYPSARILGHYQLSTNIRKACPCFDAEKEYAELY